MNNSYPIEDVVNALRLQRRDRIGNSFYCKCPLCNSKKYTLNIQTESNVWRCARCGAGGGSVHLYVAVTRGVQYTKEMRAEILPELNELLGHSQSDSFQRAVTRNMNTTKYSTQHSELSDFRLNEIYQALLQLPCLKLSLKDRQRLESRGLSDEVIQRNQYGSFYISDIMSLVPRDWVEKSERWLDLAKSRGALAGMNKGQLLSSLYVGEALNAALGPKIDPSGVPGAFRFNTEDGTMWGFRLYDGIIIPIRNRKKEIVAMQVRSTSTKNGGKYMLVSSRDMPGGRSGKGRVHYPLANSEGSRKESSAFILTEGPLKADVFADIAADHPCKIMALIGVNATKGLEKELKKLRPGMVYECFDMDKLLNPAVMKGMKKIHSICTSCGIPMKHIIWDAPGISQKLSQYMKLAEEYGVCNTTVGTESQQLIHLAQQMDGKPLPDAVKHWQGTTKGIDDYAQYLRRVSQSSN